MKAKDIYTLHLDTPRIVIVVSVMLGLIVISFLIGMNFAKDSSVQAKNMTASQLIASGAAESNFSQDLKEQPLGSESLGAKDLSQAMLGGAGTPESSSLDKKSQGGALDNSLDIVTGNNTDIFSPAAAKSEPAPKKVKVEPAKKISAAKTVQKDNKQSTKKVTAKAPVKSSNKAASVKAKPAGSSFAIQIASYDKRSKAVSEIESLKSLNYNAYLDNASVDGKQFFRVRIGPLVSHDKAAVILNELHGNSRYSTSYIVKQ